MRARLAAMRAPLSIGTAILLAVSIQVPAQANTGSVGSCNWHGIAYSDGTSVADLNSSCAYVQARIDRYVSGQIVSEYGASHTSFSSIEGVTYGTHAGNKGRVKTGTVTNPSENWSAVFTVRGS